MAGISVPRGHRFRWDCLCGRKGQFKLHLASIRSNDPIYAELGKFSRRRGVNLASFERI